MDPPQLIPFCATLFLVLLTFSRFSDATPNSENLQQSIYPFVLYPRVFEQIATQPLETPIQIRCFLYLNMAVWNAWANYHPTAVDFFGRTTFKRPSSEHTLLNKNTAILYSLFRMHQKSPETCGGDSTMHEFRKIFIERGLDPDDYSMNMSTPVGIGNREGMDTAELAAVDGWNSAGDRTSTKSNYKLPFQDYTGYTPKNDPWKLKFPLRWQPVLETDKIGYFSRQEHVTPQAGSAMMFTMTRAQANKKRVKRLYKNRNAKSGMENKMDLRNIRKYAREVFNTSSRLTETQRLIAEFFDNKVKAFQTDVNPSGVLSIAAAFRFVMFPPTLDWNMDDDIIAGMSANLVTMDAMALVWKEKVRHDNVRPTGQTMEYLFGNEKKFKVWGGPGKSPVLIRPSEWQPLIRTMPHSEYPSGTACLCTALVEEARKRLGGRAEVPYTFTVPKGSSKFYPRKVPSHDRTITIPTLSTWDGLCTISRLWAGVHFKPALSAGRRLCKGIGSMSHDIVDDMVAGKQSSPWMDWLPQKTVKFWEKKPEYYT